MHANDLSKNTFSFSNILSSQLTSRYLTTSWLGAVFVGQWFFAAYIAFQFGMPFVTGDDSGANFSHMIKGHVQGDTLGNGILIAHVLPVLILSLLGVLQLVPKIRTAFPRFHRWNGRIFLLIGLLGALTGLYLTWGRGARLSDIGAIGITLNGMLIPVAIGLAWYYARKRNFQAHKRWAIHAFILINGVWAFRLMLMGWFMVNQGPNGNSANIDGPADITFSFACYLLPMAIAELYFWAQANQNKTRLLVLNVTLMGAVAITSIGVLSAATMMWWPKIAASFA